MPIHIAHPVWMVAFLVLTAVSFSLFGFIIGLWADGFEKLQIVPLLIITPLTFLGGTFYSTSVLPPFWRTVTLFNPLVYLISGFRWSFFGIADVHIETQRGDDALVPCRLHGDRLVVLQDRLSAEELIRRVTLGWRQQAWRCKCCAVPFSSLLTNDPVPCNIFLTDGSRSLVLSDPPSDRTAKRRTNAPNARRV